MYDPEKNNVDQINTLIDAIRVQRIKLNQQLDDISKLLQELGKAEQNCLLALQEIKGT
jgi:hypothetical protein